MGSALRDSLKRWAAPALLALAVMVGYQVLVSPVIGDLLADWQFLHAARQQAIQQLRQQSKDKP